MNFIYNKKRFIIFLSISILLFISLVIFDTIFVIDNSFKTIYFEITIVFLCLIPLANAFDIFVNVKQYKWYSIVLSLFSGFFILFIIELLNSNIMFAIFLDKFIFNLVIIYTLYLSMFCITGNVKYSLIISNTILFLIGFANYMVLMFRGTPLSLLDILSVRTGMSVAFAYRLSFNLYFLVACISFVLLSSIILNINCKCYNKYRLFRIIAIVCVMLLIFVFFTTNLVSVFRLDTNLWNPKDEYKTNGFLASIIKQVKEINMSKPDNYSLELLEEIRDNNYVEEVKAVNNFENNYLNENAPNIIVIMNESFSEMQVHRDFKTNIDYMPYFKALINSCISGRVHTSVYGGKTPNSEWEFLTNNSMAFFSYTNVPYQQFIRNESYSLVSTLKAQGYTTYAIHPWYATGYRRNNVYKLFGFDYFDSLENMESKLDFIRTYPTDLSTYKYLIEKFESKENGERFFNFTITMQNHSGYDIPGMEPEVFLAEIKNCPRVEQYLTLIKKSDEALEYLINYFSNVDENTIILFFGDHQPPYIEDEFWNYLNAEKQENSLSDAEKSYLTPYFIWANYDIPKINVPDISLNYLSILLLDVAGLKTTTYMNYLRNMEAKIPVITGHGYMTKDRYIS